MGLIEDARALSDEDLSREVRFLAQRDRHCLAKTVVHLAEYDRRRLCVKEGADSLFIYCVKTLGYDEFDSFRRIRAARTISKYPGIVPLIEEGNISLTAISVLHPYLTPENHRAWFADVAGKSRRQIEAMVAARHPQGARPDVVRRFPPYSPQLAPSAPPHAFEAIPADTVTPASETAVPLGERLAPLTALPEPAWTGRPHEWQALVPISIDRVRIGFDAGIAVMNMIDRARQILRHKYPEGRLEDLVREALEILLERKDPQRRLALKKPATAAFVADAPAEERHVRDLKAGRYIPAWVKKIVWDRDRGRCAWRFEDGTVCGSRDWIEFDHVRPFAKGGRSGSPRNVRLLCRAHNSLAASQAGLSASPASA